MRDYQFVGHALLQTSAITALTSTRNYHGARLSSSALSAMPVINYYQLPGGTRRNGLESRTFTINCRDTDPAVARQLGDLVSDLFGGTSGTGVYGNSTSFTVARASVVRDNVTIPEWNEETFLVPVDVLVVYSMDTVS